MEQCINTTSITECRAVADGCCPEFPPRACSRTNDGDCKRIETGQQAVTQPTSDQGAVATGDLNGDRASDLIEGDSRTTAMVTLVNDGQGNLRPSGAGAVGAGEAGFADVAGADLNGDGHVDAVGTLPDTHELAFFPGDGSGALAVGPRSAVGAAASRLVLRDLTGDGVLDAVAATDDGVVILRGLGDGGFARLASAGADVLIADVAVEDVDADGLLDVIAALPEGNSVRVFLGRAGGALVEGPSLASNQPVALVSGDFDGDARADLAVASASDRALTIYRGTRDGFAATPLSRLADVALTRLLRADLNGDGRADLVGLEAESGRALTFLGRGDGTFDDAAAGAPVVSAGTPARGLAVADLNGDLLPDILVSAPQLVIGTIGSSGPAVLAGDATGEGFVNELDRAQLAAELFDGDGTDALSCAGGATASAAGADGNRDGHLDAADVVGVARGVPQ